VRVLIVFPRLIADLMFGIYISPPIESCIQIDFFRKEQWIFYHACECNARKIDELHILTAAASPYRKHKLDKMRCRLWLER
ncbi:MAG: hypothetical protein WCC10_10870, partial [Tumebacillaceae bacterium]